MERYHVFGGAIRLVKSYTPVLTDIWFSDIWGNPSREWLMTAVKDTRTGAFSQSANSFKGRLLHLYPREGPPPSICSEYSWDHRETRWASGEVAKKVTQELLLSCKDNLSQELLHANLNGDFSERGMMFEVFAHGYLRGNGKKQKVTIGSVFASTLLFRTGMTLENCPADTYMLPASRCYPSVDALAKTNDRVLLFQVTAAVSHPISMRGLEVLFAVDPRTAGGCN